MGRGLARPVTAAKPDLPGPARCPGVSEHTIRPPSAGVDFTPVERAVSKTTTALVIPEIRDVSPHTPNEKW